MLSLENIRMLILADELGSFSACARRLGKVQSAVSHGINNLEIDLGVELFDRTSRSPRLTPEGQRLLRSAKALLAQADEFERMAGSVSQHEQGALTLAIDDGLHIAAVNRLLGQFAERYPYLQLDLLLSLIHI